MRTLLCLATAALLPLASLPADAEPASAEPAVDPTELVRGLIASESGIRDIESLRIRIEGSWTRSPGRIAIERTELERKWPAQEVTPKRFPELRPEQKETTELAFDRTRLRCEHSEEGYRESLSVWDGRQAWLYSRFETHEQESYNLDRALGIHFAFLDGLEWLRAGVHHLWWHAPRWSVGGITFYVSAKDELVSEPWGTPERYVSSGKRSVRGRECHVLDLKVGWNDFLRRLYVGVDDGRLHGEVSFQRLGLPEMRETFGRIAGEPIQDNDAWNTWLDRASPQARDEAELRLCRTLYAASRPSVEWRFEDYRQAARGLWIPWSFGYTLLPRAEEPEDAISRRDLRVTDVTVGGALPDELFVMNMREGVKVYDQRHDPPLLYTSKKEFTPQEWQAILDENAQRAARVAQLQTGMDTRLGERAIELPAEGWLNTRPVRLADLKGRVVVLDFWATWCGPCRNDLPLMEAAHKGREATGITVIGVHTPTPDLEAVRKVAKDSGLTYPICIDAEKPDGGPGFGHLSSWYGVRGIPHAFVIDREGRVAAHGSLDEALEKARELIAARSKD